MMKAMLALSVMFVTAASAAAQDSACTYDRCALRLQSRASGVRIVQGAQGTNLGRIGLYPPRINLLATADDSTRLHYEAFREYHSRSATFGLVSLVFTVGGAVLVYASDDETADWTGFGLSVVGLGFSIGASSSSRRGRDELSQAIWFYNRRFAR
jgi:hypothetical protein